MSGAERESGGVARIGASGVGGEAQGAPPWAGAILSRVK